MELSQNGSMMAMRTRDDLIGELVGAWRAARLQTDVLDAAVFRRLGINRTDGRCLDGLGSGPLSASALAELIGVTPNALTTVVDRLSARGLVERVADPDDRRRVLVRQTPLAERLSQQLYAPLMARSMSNLQRYTKAELALLADFLERSRQVQSDHLEHVRSVELDWDEPSRAGP